MSRVLLGAALAAVALVAACGGGSKRNERSDWEEKNERLLREAPDTVPTPPQYPADQNLLKFFVTSASDFGYFVDRTSIAAEGPVVRYVLVARSPSGVDNVFFEAVNCKDRQFRTYARGTNDRKWIVRPTEWRDVASNQRAQFALYHDYFCPNGAPILSTNEGVNALEKGGHPWAVLPNTQGLRSQPNVR